MACIYPIGGGKGGIGKSFVTANLGVLLAKQQKSVVLVDLDLGGSNLHTFLGCKHPQKGLNDFLDRTVQNLEQAAVPTAIPNLSLISSENCSVEISNLFYTQKMKIIKAINNLPFDYIFLDLGAGTNFNTLDFFLASNEGIFIVTPEPTSIENTFHFIKAAYSRKLKQILKQPPFKKVVKAVCDSLKNMVIKSPGDIVKLIASHDPGKGDMLLAKLEDLHFGFILNQLRRHTDTTIGEKIEKVCNKHFFSNFQFLGKIHYDERVYEAISFKNIYMNKYPYSVGAVDLQLVAKRILDGAQDEAVPLGLAQ